MPDKKKDPRVAREPAELFFEEWAEAMDLDFDTAFMDEDDVNGFNKQKNKVVKALMDGSAKLNDDKEIVYTARNGRSAHKEAITFRERTGRSAMKMDGKKKGQDVHKLYAIMADMAGLHEKDFAGMVGIDAKFCETICVLLMD